MVNLSISNAVSGLNSSVSNDTLKPTPQAATAQSVEIEDTVQISQSGQIHALSQQGKGAEEIATELGVPIATVTGILGIVSAAAIVDLYIPPPRANPFMETPRTTWW
jgi:hypothetical protein